MYIEQHKRTYQPINPDTEHMSNVRKWCIELIFGMQKLEDNHYNMYLFRFKFLCALFLV